MNIYHIKRVAWSICISFALLGFSNIANAFSETMGVNAPNCNLQQMQELCNKSKDCMGVTPRFEGVYDVTFFDGAAQVRFLHKRVDANSFCVVCNPGFVQCRDELPPDY